MTKRQALKNAQQVKKSLTNSKGWTVRVWENNGWHASLQRGGLTLFWRDYTHYEERWFFTLLSARTPGIGDTFWSSSKNFKNPNKAIEHQMKVAKRFIIRVGVAYSKAMGI